VVFGVEAFETAPDELDRLDAQRVMLIADRSGHEWADQLAARLGPRLVARTDEVRMHVPIEVAEAARTVAVDSLADAIVTIGGGSATGLGKAVVLELPLRFVAVPTTYAGSEMTPIWGLTSGARKITGRDPRVQPQTVIYDPRLTMSLPPAIAGPSAMNALAHCAEALYADGANPVTSMMAEEGIATIASTLPRLAADPYDPDVRSKLLYAAYLAGAALATAGSGIHHKICHVLGGAYDLPHAEMHTVVLPHALAFKAPAVPDAMRRMAHALGSDDVSAAVFDLGAVIGAPGSLAAIGMPESHLEEAARLIVEAAPDESPPVTIRAIRGLLDRAFHGRRPSHSSARPTPVAV